MLPISFSPFACRCIILIQSAIRSHLCRKHILPYKRAMLKHRLRRSADRRWRNEQKRMTVSGGDIQRNETAIDAAALMHERAYMVGEMLTKCEYT
jgi:hypothetical protein